MILYHNQEYQPPLTGCAYVKAKDFRENTLDAAVRTILLRQCQAMLEAGWRVTPLWLASYWLNGVLGLTPSTVFKIRTEFARLSAAVIT